MLVNIVCLAYLLSRGYLTFYERKRKSLYELLSDTLSAVLMTWMLYVSSLFFILFIGMDSYALARTGLRRFQTLSSSGMKPNVETLIVFFATIQSILWILTQYLS